MNTSRVFARKAGGSGRRWPTRRRSCWSRSGRWRGAPGKPVSKTPAPPCRYTPGYCAVTGEKAGPGNDERNCWQSSSPILAAARSPSYHPRPQIVTPVLVRLLSGLTSTMRSPVVLLLNKNIFTTEAQRPKEKNRGKEIFLFALCLCVSVVSNLRIARHPRVECTAVRISCIRPPDRRPLYAGTQVSGVMIGLRCFPILPLFAANGALCLAVYRGDRGNGIDSRCRSSTETSGM